MIKFMEEKILGTGRRRHGFPRETKTIGGKVTESETVVVKAEETN